MSETVENEMVTTVTGPYGTLMTFIDEERAAVEVIINLMQRHPDLANKLAIVLKLASEKSS